MLKTLTQSQCVVFMLLNPMHNVCIIAVVRGFIYLFTKLSKALQSQMMDYVKMALIYFVLESIKQRIKTVV